MHAAAQPDVLEFTINREHVLVAVRYSCTGVPDWYGSTVLVRTCTVPVHSHSLRYLPADRAGAVSRHSASQTQLAEYFEKTEE